MRRTHVTLADIERWHRQGRGVGVGATYIPWLKTRDVASTGRSRRLRGLKTGRIHHLLSDLEFKHFLMLEFNEQVIDIREQYPLFPLDNLMGIADALSVDYPNYVGTSTPYVLTTDLLATYLDCDGKRRLHARSVKYASDLADQRTREKLEIERVYWKIQGETWDIATEGSINNILFKNLNWLRFGLGNIRQCFDQPKILGLLDHLQNHACRSDCLRTVLEKSALHLAVADEIIVIWFKYLAWRRLLPLDLENERILLIRPLSFLAAPTGTPVTPEESLAWAP
jgi:hypothetical protein